MKKKGDLRYNSGILTAKDMKKLRKLMSDVSKLTSEKSVSLSTFEVNVAIKGVASAQPDRTK